MAEVSVVRCDDYEKETVAIALQKAIDGIGGLDFVKPGMTVAIKANLVCAAKPEKAAVTHPTVLAELTRMLVLRGARVIVGDSPGGLYTAAALYHVYRASGMHAVEEAGGELNHNFSQETVHFPTAMVCKQFPYTSWLSEADVIVDVCKLKTHGMMGMSGAAKNLFGVIPGTVKPEYHYRFPDHADFARMLIDLDDYVNPVLSVCDAVVCMEGNGPTGGTPRKLGCLIASKSPHKLDLAAASLIGLSKEKVPTLVAAFERGYIPATAEALSVDGELKEFFVSDFQNVAINESKLFSAKGYKGIKRVFWTVAEKALVSRPSIDEHKCVGCGKCRDLCPAHTISLSDGKAHINKKKCIRCFCCQEFCPAVAISVKRTVVARLLNRL